MSGAAAAYLFWPLFQPVNFAMKSRRLSVRKLLPKVKTVEEIKIKEVCFAFLLQMHHSNPDTVCGPFYQPSKFRSCFFHVMFLI
jgi:hypothetical protein